MNSTSVYIEVGQSWMKVSSENGTLELPLDRLQNGRVTNACKQSVTAGLRDFLKRKSWQPNLRALCAIGARGVSLRRLTLPSSSKEELPKLLRFQIESEFPLPPEQLAWGYRQITQSAKSVMPGKQEFVLVAIKKEVIQDYVEIFSGSGLNAVFTLASCARSLLIANPPDSYSVLAIGRISSEMISFADGVPDSIRVLSWGEEAITRSIQEKLGVSPEEAEKFKIQFDQDSLSDGELAAKVEGAMDAALESLLACLNPKWIGQKIYLGGKNTGGEHFATRLCNRFTNGVTCELLPEDNFSTPISGLKKFADKEANGRVITFQLNETKNGESLTRPASWKWAVAAGLLALGLLFLPYAEAVLLKSRLTKKLSAIQADKGRLAIIDRELGFLQNLKKNQSPYLDTLYLIANAAPSGSRFDSLSMNRRGDISLKGNMGNAQQVTDFRSKLIATGFFSTVVVDEQTPTPDRQKLTVRITAQWKPSGRKPVVVEPTTSTTDKQKRSAGFQPASPEAKPKSGSPRMSEDSPVSTNLPPVGKTN